MNLGNAASPLLSLLGWWAACVFFSLKTDFLSCSMQMVRGMAASQGSQVHKLSHQPQARLAFCLFLPGFHITTARWDPRGTSLRQGPSPGLLKHGQGAGPQRTNAAAGDSLLQIPVQRSRVSGKHCRGSPEHKVNFLAFYILD